LQWKQVFDEIDAEQERAIEEGAAFLTKEIEKVDDVARDLGLTFSSAFEAALIGGNSLRDVLRGLEQDILRIFARKLITEPFANVLTSAIGSSGAGGMLASAGNWLAGLFGGKFADGGYLAPGRWGVAGERGPEVIYGGRTGVTVQPSSAMRVTQVFHLSGPADRRTQQQIAAAASRGLAMAGARLN
jgi:hypothetical protein